MLKDEEKKKYVRQGPRKQKSRSPYSLLRNTSCAIIMIAIFPQDNLKYNVFSRYLQNQSDIK